MNWSFLTRPRILLMIGDDGIVVVPHEILDRQPFFVPGDNRHSAQEIVEFIARHPRARITLLVDNLAQDYRCDILPRLNFLDRAKLMQRRLHQQFPAARLTASLKMGTRKCLMIGLHESNPVFDWAERLRSRLPAISLLPVEGVRLAAQLIPGAAAGWSMLISRHKSGGFRQIVTLNNELIFTRLTPLPDTRNGDAEAIARDIKASLDYLTRHGLRHARDLSVLIVMPGEIHQSSMFENLGLRSLQSLAPHAAAQKLGLAFAPRENDHAADLLFAAHFMNKARPALSLMLPEIRQDKLTRSVRQWGLAMASIALITALSLTGWQASDYISTLTQTRDIAASLDQTRQALKQTQAEAAPLTEPLGRLRQAIERQRIYATPQADPWDALWRLSKNIDNRIRLVKIDWKKAQDSSSEILTVGLRMKPDPAAPPDTERADVVAAFTHAAQQIAQAMPDYTVISTEPPYPALPQETVTAETRIASDNPIGVLTLEKRIP